MNTKIDQILDVLESEQLRAFAKCESICVTKLKRADEGRVQAFVYYGSSLRAMNDPDKMLDFYVLVDSYRKTHRSPLRVLINAMLPPSVYYMENRNEDGSLSVCKYSIISLGAFEKKCTGKSLLSVVWGRFSQPCVLLFPASAKVNIKGSTARAHAILHVSDQTKPLVSGKNRCHQILGARLSRKL